MAAPVARFRGALSAPGLIKSLRRTFSAVPDARRAKSVRYSLADTLGSAFAMFSLKYPSMLRFDEESHADPRLIHNLAALYGVEHVPSDTSMREILDKVDPVELRPAFESLQGELQRGKALESFTVLEGRYLLAVDGTGQFASTAISCPHCCVKKASKKKSKKANAASPSKDDAGGGGQFYHQSLAAALVHPDIKGIALPIALEPITRADGAAKNDCERNAAKRLLPYIAEAYPRRRFCVVEDALASNGPHIELLLELGMDFILGVKPDGNAALFAEVHRRQGAGELVEWEDQEAADGSISGYRFTCSLALNASHENLDVNYLEWWECDKNGKQTSFTWVTNLPITIENVFEIMRAARARWRIENEVFSTLKNQGYEYEHNFGHGKRHLSSTLAALMMLAFLVDQIQEHACRVFKEARTKRGTKATLWLQMRAMMTTWRMTGWKMMMDLLIDPDRVLMPSSESG